jgi:hypothetical protein
MRSTYRVLAYLVAGLVFVQSAAVVFAVAGLGKWVEGGGVMDKAAMESEDVPFSEGVGFMIHGMNGMMLIPLVALSLLIVSFFARIPGGIAYAGAVLALVALQVTLGLLGHETPALGALHGMNALVLLLTAVQAGRRVTGVVAAAEEQSAPASVPA